MPFLAFTCPEWYKLFTPLTRGSRVDPGDRAREREAWLGFLVIRANDGCGCGSQDWRRLGCSRLQADLISFL